MAEITISSGRVKLIKDLPVGDDLTGTEAYAMLQNNVTKQSTILDIGRYTKTLDYSTWVYANSGTSSYVNQISSSILLKDPTESNSTTQYINSNVIVAGSVTALGNTSLATVSVQSASSFRIENQDRNAIALIVNQTQRSPGITRMRETSSAVFFVGPLTNTLGQPVTSGIVGVRTENPNRTFTVNGEISSSSHFSTSGNVYANFVFGDGRNLQNIDGSRIQNATITGDKLTGTINISAIPLNSIIFNRINENASIYGYQLNPEAGLVAQQIAPFGTSIINGRTVTSIGLAANQMSPTANIVGTQLSPTANIVGTQLASNANILGDQIAASTITNNNISNTTITSQKLSTGSPQWTSNGNLTINNDASVSGSVISTGNISLSGDIYMNEFKGIYTKDTTNTVRPLLLYDNVNNITKLHNVGGVNSVVRITNQGGNAALAEVDAIGNFIATGDVTAFSDERLKKNVKTIENALEKVNQLRGVEFERTDIEKKQIGVIAQEVEKIIPEVVSQGQDYKSVSYGNLVGLLIEAVKDLTKEVENLKAQINKNA
jgi:hypothetical protein